MEEDIDFDRGDERQQVGPDLQIIIDELTAVCNSLGKLDENDGTYMKDRDCKPCLKEIIRILNSDSKQHIVRQKLGQLNIIKSDLIPLIDQYCDFNDGDIDLFNLVVRICTNLTSSVFLLFENQEMPTELDMIKVYNILMNGLYRYKEAFADDPKFWTMLNAHLWHTEDEVPFERLLILLRNILHIPVDSSADLGMHSEFDTHALCLYRMEQSGLFHTIIKIASETQRGSEFCFHIIEIVHLMLRDQNPATIIKSKANPNKRKLDDDDEDRKRLAELSARDRCDRQVGKSKFVQPRFKNSLFVVKNCQSIGQNRVLTRRIIDRAEDITFDSGKTQLRKAKNRKPFSSETSSAVISDRNTKPSQVTYKLKLFSKLFVEKVYANYMQQIKHNLIQKKAAENDESYYLWAIQYFTAFNRLLYLNLDNVSETMSTSTLHFIQILITSYQDKIKIEKKRSQIERISKRLHLAIRAYREILYLIKSIEQSSDFWNTIEKIKKNVFTEIEYNSLLLTLLQQYEESKHCPEYLKDLISTNDIFLDLLEEYSKTHDPVEMAQDDESDNEDNLLSELRDPDAHDQVDPLAPTDQDGQSVAQNQNHDDLGSPNVGDQPERPNLDDQHEVEPPLEDQLEKMDENGKNEQENPETNGTGKKKRLSKKRKKTKKKDLRTIHFMSRYCSPDVVRAYLDVLRDFKTNDSTLNLQVLKFFKRMVYECKCEVMLMQASTFACFLEIIDYHKSMPGYDEFVALSKHLMSIFGDMVCKKRWMIQELLFWKTNNDIIEIENAVDPPKPSSPVARSPNFENDELPMDSQGLVDEPEEPPVDSLEELINEIGSDSSPDASDNEAELPGNAVVDEDEEDEIFASAPQTSYARTRLISGSEESDASEEKISKSCAKRDVFLSDSDDLSSPPSPVPSPSPEPGGSLSDMPSAAGDVE